MGAGWRATGSHSFRPAQIRRGIRHFPGALTRVSTEESPAYRQRAWRRKQGYMGAGAADFEELAPDRTRLREALLPSQHVSSRVAEAFIGRDDTSSERTIWR